MLVFVVDNSTRQMLGNVEVIESGNNGSSQGKSLVTDSQGFITMRNPVLMGEVARNGKADIMMQPIFQNIPIPEIKVKVSSYFIIESKEIEAMYDRVLSIHHASQAGIVIPNPRIELKPV